MFSRNCNARVPHTNDRINRSIGHPSGTLFAIKSSINDAPVINRNVIIFRSKISRNIVFILS